jgi:hypothetical protein
MLMVHPGLVANEGRLTRSAYLAAINRDRITGERISSVDEIFGILQMS